MPRSLVARYDASLGNHRKAEAMRKERSERTAARATQATLQREHAQNTTRTAEALGMTREGLHKKLARFGMHE